MRTVKEISEYTGISVRILHYYDEIGLLKPTSCSEAGYRLYDDRALERLQQILFFREFDMPLKAIAAVMQSPELDKEQILCSQRKMLEQKKVFEEKYGSMEEFKKQFIENAKKEQAQKNFEKVQVNNQTSLIYLLTP